MRFYVQATQEHPNEQGVYPLITEGTLQFFTKESYESTPESERLSKDLRPLNSQDTFIEFDIPDSLKTAALKVILEGSDTYAQHPLDPDIITKPCLYTKQTSPQKLRFPKQKQAKANIGIIKAYKKDNLTQTFLPDIDSLSNPHNEIYTIDTDQEIQLRAFVYEEQKYYAPKVVDETKQVRQNHALQQGNITKTIITDRARFNDIAEESIKWAFIILEGTYLADTQGRTTSKPPLGKKPILQYPNTTNTPQANAIDSHSLESKDIDSNNPQSQSKLTTIPQGYVELQNLRGDCITLKLSDIFDESLLDSNNPSSLIGKNIVFFAYSNTPAYDIYSDNGNDKNRIITKDRVTSIELKILQTRFSLEFDGEYLSLYENQRKIGEWEARSGTALAQSTKPIAEEEYFITTTYNPQLLTLHKIDCNHKDEICALFQQLKIQEQLSLPLKVQYQKRILIIIERFRQTTESTMGRMHIYIDTKRVDSNGNIIGAQTKNYEYYNPKNLPEDNPYAYILERSGPDSIGGELRLRVPEGRYNALWHNGTRRQNVLKLYNEYVSANRAILIHEGYTKDNTNGLAQGTSPRNTFGCLVIAKNRVKDKHNPSVFVDNILSADSSTKANLTKAIQDSNGFLHKALDKPTTPQEIAKHIEVRVENRFETAQIQEQEKIQIFNQNGIYLFSIERKDRTETKLSTEELYGISGIQWFESSADNYHKLIDVNPDLQDKEKCKETDNNGLGVLYFDWKDIVEFALIDRYSFQYNPYGNGNWKAVENGAKGYILVSMEGIPYWADAVGQLPFAIDIYRKRLSETKNKDLSRKFVIQKGYEYGNGLPFIGYDNSNSYDNAMILRGVNWAEKNFDIDGSGVRNNNIDTSLLRFDSQGKIVYEW